MEAQKTLESQTTSPTHSCLYHDRSEAGATLAESLRHYRDQHPLVIGISRQGMRVAHALAHSLGCDLDVMAVRTIGAPGHDDFVLGAVTSDGTSYVNASLRKLMRVPESIVQRSLKVRHTEARLRERRCRRNMPALDPAGRVVILVDDDLPTGTTMRAALRSVRARAAKTIIVAAPVASVDACHSLANDVDELVCPHRVDAFAAVAPHYSKHEQTSEADVEGLLRSQRRDSTPSFSD